ncbi:3-carboxy-cis,cis-muconate cycloisomerase [Citrobacter amalonaticus]|uniref:3-carboxy-cis,cis-muconate cycloisomerase n=1 Tax=Citrobacter amalonaticus TaxID=35703 RepID=A0A2S4S1D8_CITAM|nr:3-carboxy-cis,cis-muconate cycloisomerase [Citrobacter amalonaticus]POT55194.1 3-carboxy-cis,cis-muconate cycloisomerase [Citrobacter amalonaticus]POT77198.1 3-carboxy-cis,cis-muconate cycloisomerase [Citrobacter amalonaticus]POU67649.1 3-carboxy-cis,cis-muconate cycloisomerase [Citrobacter amalonaticus]POV07254.1 3-carboxy-cis,cis-muconate cycloisomerase [Citrobacter amalonaticus]
MTLFTPLMRGSALTEPFSDSNLVQKMLDFEAALACAQAECGVIPPLAVAPIASASRVENIDMTALADSASYAGNLAIPLVKQLTAQVRLVDEEAARYVHWGATSQDVIDTGTILQLREALAGTQGQLSRLIDTFAEQAARYQQTVMPGRTWMQQALPVTWGLKLAGTLDALLRWQTRLQQLLPRLMVLQFGGAAGTLASLKEDALPVAEKLAQALGLALPDTPWHTQRDRLLEVGAWYAGVGGTLAKFAQDFSLLMQTEVAEVSEADAPGRGGSSAMPHKRNPVSCASILTAMQRTPGLMTTLYSCQLQQHERALGGWQAEWEVLPEIIMLVGHAMEQTQHLTQHMQVFPDKMRENLDITRGLMMAESVTLALAAFIGKADAHHVLESLCRRSVEENTPLQMMLVNEPRVTDYLTISQIARLLDPTGATGSAGIFVERVLSRYKEHRYGS